MKIKLIFGVLVTGLIAFNNSQAYEELGKISTDLATGPSPALAEIGNNIVIMRNGAEVSYTVTAKDNKSISMQGSGGCSFTDPIFPNNLTTITPSIGWENCGGSSGRAKVKIKGELFPLAKGNKVVFNVNGETTQGSWTGTWKNRRVCKVKGKYRVKTVSGEHDTWKIVCSENSGKRTIYYSPDLGVSVASKRKHKDNKKRNYTAEYIRTE